jgi:hypothetical protein
MVQAAISVRAVGVSKNKKKGINTSRNCIFHVYGEQTPLNRLLSFLTHRVTSRLLSFVQNFISIGQGVTAGRGSKNRMFP